MIYVDRHLVHEVTSPQAFEGLRMAGRTVRRPDATLAVADHNTPTTPVGEGGMDEESRIQVETLEKNVAEFGVPYFGMNDARHGIVHVIGPEQGLTLPGMTIVCGDSHTSTHGAFGALAFGIGTSEVEHVLATQTLIQKPAKNMRVAVEGSLPLGVTAKDVILAIIGKLGTAGGTGYVIEYAGRAIRELTMEGRMTVCNMSIEAGARAGLIAPDETTFKYLEGRPYAPKGGAWELALGQWRRLPSRQGRALRHASSTSIAADIPPMVTWGTSPQDALPITDVIPDPANAPDENRREAWTRSLAYMGLTPGTRAGRRADRPRVHRLVHQRPHRGSARRRRDRARPQGRVERVGHGRAGLRPGEGRGREGRSRQDLPRGRLRMAHAGLLDVPGDERRPARARPALRLDLEPQLRGPPGPRRTHPSGEPGDGGGGRHQGHPGRRARLPVGATANLHRSRIGAVQQCTAPSFAAMRQCARIAITISSRRPPWPAFRTLVPPLRHRRPSGTPGRRRCTGRLWRLLDPPRGLHHRRHPAHPRAVGGLGSILGFSLMETDLERQRSASSTCSSVVIGWLYFALMESSERGATVGKMALGLRVVDEQRPAI